jgi:hypothetical protein
MCAKDREVSTSLLGVGLWSTENLSQPQSDPASVLVGKVFEYRLKLGVGFYFGVERTRELEKCRRSSRVFEKSGVALRRIVLVIAVV